MKPSWENELLIFVLDIYLTLTTLIVMILV